MIAFLLAKLMLDKFHFTKSYIFSSAKCIVLFCRQKNKKLAYKSQFHGHNNEINKMNGINTNKNMEQDPSCCFEADGLSSFFLLLFLFILFLLKDLPNFTSPKNKWTPGWILHFHTTPVQKRIVSSLNIAVYMNVDAATITEVRLSSDARPYEKCCRGVLSF